MPELRLDMTLWHRTTRVGKLYSVVVHQGTWIATRFRRSIRPGESPLAGRICEFITFCKGWHRRIDDEATSAAEFDQFLDVNSPGAWSVRGPDDVGLEISQSPVFDHGEVSWCLVECDRSPSPEGAAWEIWSRLAAR